MSELDLDVFQGRQEAEHKRRMFTLALFTFLGINIKTLED